MALSPGKIPSLFQLLAEVQLNHSLFIVSGKNQNIADNFCNCDS